MAGLARLLYSEKLLKGSLTTRNEKKHTENATVRRSKDLKKTKPLKEEATDSRPDYLLQVEETLMTTTRGPPTTSKYKQSISDQPFPG